MPQWHPAEAINSAQTANGFGHSGVQAPCFKHGRPRQGAPHQAAFGRARMSLSAATSAASQGDAPENALAKASSIITSLFPFWVILAAVSAFHRPELFTWFTPAHINNGLMFVMLGMGLTLTFKEILNVFTKQPQLLALGMVLQYTVLPAIGFAISRHWGLERGLAIGVALVSCMPGGTASNIVAFIAKGDMPLSVMMTSASTLMAVFMTPFLATILVGQLVPVDPTAMFLSVLQLVLAPVMVGCTINTVAPAFVKRVRPFMPLVATAVVVLIVGSLISCNVSVVGTFGPLVMPAVIVLHSAGFCSGYWFSKTIGTSDKIARTFSIEVGMQSSALAAVLARIHFPGEPMVVAACVISACTMSLMGSMLAGIWSVTTADFDA
eukprot:CAMPEP_0119104544 /NCGR_PEP_ID=MMETSP1180-20130426/2733_1 /TAXON_ID=3052 ORGANISM="Chlamydomonas cf sp, Strain CCMP681" /NCGR_SAMPLE_ID=MMETSP1180 /ASSEMBLY_ACC=CAM_ASM_000741 /LENGTH=380 /DNA_ID=CAMNT_0007089339 /DNA_START=114 /DNA_END=1257 /DNA_ORIENTATION=-